MCLITEIKYKTNIVYYNIIPILFSVVFLTLQLMPLYSSDLFFLGGFNVINSNPLISIWRTWSVRVNIVKQGATQAIKTVIDILLTCVNKLFPLSSLGYRHINFSIM